MYFILYFGIQIFLGNAYVYLFVYLFLILAVTVLHRNYHLSACLLKFFVFFEILMKQK